MFNTKLLRTTLMQMITGALSGAGVIGFDVSHAINKKGSNRYVVFGLQDLPAMDERNQMDLEINVVGPMSDSDTVEAASDVIIGALDRAFQLTDDVAFYLYKSTRNRVDGSDPHTVRYRCNFDLYLYERNE